jgi:hypothetical protein
MLPSIIRSLIFSHGNLTQISGAIVGMEIILPPAKEGSSVVRNGYEVLREA